MTEIETPRLRLRAWRTDDAGRLFEIYTDPEVVRFLTPMDRDATERQIARFVRGWEQDGFCLWAAEDKATGALIGRIGLIRHRDWPLDPEPVEVGWTLARPYWGRGLATEGGAASLRYGFGALGFQRIISIALPANAASRRVMEKCGLTYRGTARWRGHEQVWYAIERDAWLARSEAGHPREWDEPET